MIRRRARLLPLAALVAVAGVVAAPAQQGRPEPEPYDPAEFTPALRDMRRAEIIAVGAFPFALLLSTLVYDFARWAGEGFQQPWGEPPFVQGEKVGIALAAVGVSVAVAVADYLLVQASVPATLRTARPGPAAAPAAAATTSPVALPYTGVLSPSLATLWPSGTFSQSAEGLVGPPARVAMRHP